MIEYFLRKLLKNKPLITTITPKHYFGNVKDQCISFPEQLLYILLLDINSRNFLPHE
jgi:hypothetical protein